MTPQPLEITVTRTDTQRIEDAITTAMTNLQHDWPHMIRPGETQAPGMAGRSGVLLDDHDHRDADQNRITKTLSLRRFAQDQLKDWCLLICQERLNLHDDKRQKIPYRLPYGSDVPAMTEFISRHAEWLSWHDSATDCRDELRDLAHRCHLVAFPKKRESMSIGRCPLQTPGEQDVLETCGGDVRVRLLPDEKPGEAYAACGRCGEVAVASWWAERMFVDGEGSPLVTAAELIAVIAYQLHIVVTHEQVRQWKHRTKIRAEGTDSKGRNLYRHADVIDAIRSEVRAKAVGA